MLHISIEVFCVLLPDDGQQNFPVQYATPNDYALDGNNQGEVETQVCDVESHGFPDRVLIRQGRNLVNRDAQPCCYRLVGA